MTDALAQLAIFTDMALKVLAVRVLCVVALTMTFALFSWAMYLQTLLAFGISGAFGVTIFLPTLWVGLKGASDA